MRTAALLAIIAVVLLGLNLLVTKLDNSYVETVILLCGIYVTLAVSLNLINGFTGQFSLGHAAFFGIGAYVGAVFTVFIQITPFGRWLAPGESLPWLHGGIMLVLAMLLGGLGAAAAGWIVGLPSLKLRGDYLAIVTLGFNQIVAVILRNLDIVGGPRGFQSIDRGDSFIQIPTLTSFFWAYFVAAITIIVCINIRKSVHGLAFFSIREDEIAAEAMGVPTTRYKVTAFVLGSFFAGMAGVLFAHLETFIKPDEFDFVSSTIPVTIVIMVVIGGMGSVTGAAIAAVILTALPEYLRNVSPAVDQYRPVIFALVLILVMLLRPQGIFGHDEFGRFWLKKQVLGFRTLPARTKTWFAGIPSRLARPQRPNLRGTDAKL
jgi:branched-chain amino acid transport system permease protein